MKRAVFIASVMLLVLCGCMSPEERAAWERKMEQKRIENEFYFRGVWYPGTREQYIVFHPTYEIEDMIVVLAAFSREVVVGNLDGDIEIDLQTETPLLFADKRLRDLKRFSADERKEIDAALASQLADLSSLLNTFIKEGYFTRGMTLEQVRAAL